MEKKSEEIGAAAPVGDEKGYTYSNDVEGDGRRHSASRRKGSAVDPEVLAGEIFDERYETMQRGLKSRHAQMIALGGTIGTGLFVGSGQTLARGGPAFILGSYILMSFLIFCVVSGIIEVAAYLPTPGSSMVRNILPGALGGKRLNSSGSELFR